MIIALSAKKQHGKDTVANIIQELTNNKFKIVKFADILKDFVCNLISCTRDELENEEFKNTPLPSQWDFLDDDCIMQKMTPRLLLQKIGTDAMRNNVHQNVWINSTLSKYKENYYWIITDLRFKNEAEALNSYNSQLIRINRPSIKNIDYHQSEIELDDYTGFDYTIVNDSDLDTLKSNVKKILQELEIIK